MKVVTIYAEASPNPNSQKFVFNFNLVENVTVDYPSREDATNSPLARDLFDNFSFVKRVFIAANFVTITKDENVDWFEVGPEVSDFLRTYFQEERPLFDEAIREAPEVKAQIDTTEDNDTVAKIKALLNDYVRPAVEQDGGAISFHSYDAGTVKVLLQGSCSGCPSSTLTLKSGIENLLKRMMPDEVNEVIAEGV